MPIYNASFFFSYRHRTPIFLKLWVHFILHTKSQLGTSTSLFASEVPSAYPRSMVTCDETEQDGNVCIRSCCTPASTCACCMSIPRSPCLLTRFPSVTVPLQQTPWQKVNKCSVWVQQQSESVDVPKRAGICDKSWNPLHVKLLFSLLLEASCCKLGSI